MTPLKVLTLVALAIVNLASADQGLHKGVTCFGNVYWPQHLRNTIDSYRRIRLSEAPHIRQLKYTPGSNEVWYLLPLGTVVNRMHNPADPTNNRIAVDSNLNYKMVLMAKQYVPTTGYLHRAHVAPCAVIDGNIENFQDVGYDEADDEYDD